MSNRYTHSAGAMAPATNSLGELPLDGITVVAVEQAVAAPFASRQLADLGARVIKIERPDGGDFARGYDRKIQAASPGSTSEDQAAAEADASLSSAFLWLNRGKESVVLDIKTAEGFEMLDRLIGQADVFIQNLSPSAARRAGLDPDSIRQRHPQVIPCAISGYGDTGPLADSKAYDLLVQGETGMISLTGNGEMMAKVGISIADIAAGSYTYSSVLAALLHRFRTGEPLPVRISLFDALSEWLGYPLYYTLYGGTEPARRGTSHATIAPYGAYTTGDGKIILLAVQNEREWRRFCRIVMDDEELAFDDRFDSHQSRVAHGDLLDELIGTRFYGLDQATALALLEQGDIAVARLNGIADLAEHRQLVDRNRWTDTATPVGHVRTLLPPWSPRGVRNKLGSVPTLGQHTEDVLGWLSRQSHASTDNVEPPMERNSNP